ncbi:MAG: STM4015 family protein [Chloroflexi bacterium]|nr:STM4015 family protein [Chloroflexota bacterium]
MTIGEHATEFAGLPVIDWEPGTSLPANTIPRVSLSYEAAEEGERWVDRFAALLSDPAAASISGLVVGSWDESGASEDLSSSVVEALVNAHQSLPNLRALFLGDIISEESEISWIHQSDISPLFDAYPTLEHLTIRGGNDLQLGRLRHDRLRSLIIQSGGLPASVVREVAAAELPSLEHLELWLGSDDYGGNSTVEDLQPILEGTRFPQLVTLGLRDSEQTDEIASAVANAPILDRIRVLDLSLGTLSDEGAAALLASPAVARLEKLDLHHHYCSAEMVARLEALGITVDVSDAQEEDEYGGERYRYAAVTE